MVGEINHGALFAEIIKRLVYVIKAKYLPFRSDTVSIGFA